MATLPHRCTGNTSFYSFTSTSSDWFARTSKRKRKRERDESVYLLLSFLFAELDPFLLSPSTHLLRIQRFVLIALHPVVVFPRTRHDG